jgi:large subunit ribosomal protein L35
MPKMKSRRGAAKRFSLTGSGKVRKNKANKSHLLSRKSMDRKRSLRKSGAVSDADANRVKKMLGLK